MSILSSLSEKKVNPLYYSDEFRQLLYDHIDLIREESKRDIVKVTKGQLLRFAGNNRALFSELKIPPSLHWICAKINRIEDDHTPLINLETLIFPNASYIDRLYLKWTTKKK